MLKTIALRWFNDGKRMTAVVLWLFALLEPWIRSTGFPLPEGVLVQVAPEVAGLILVGLSKADVKLPLPAK